MQWWPIFFQVRRTIFVFIAVVSLLLAIALSVYTAREWSHLLAAQRGIILGMIAVNAFSALLMYLMVVVVFRVWLDLARVLFLLLIHIASALVFTLFGGNFSCDVFSSKSQCKHVDLALLIGSWAMTGLLLGYLIYLLAMLRVRRSLPRVIPNLLDTEIPDTSRPASMTSIDSMNSTTGLLRAARPVSVVTPRAASPPMRYYVVNSSPADAMFSPTTPGPPHTAARSPLQPAPPMPSLPSTVRPPQIRTSFSRGVDVRRPASTHLTPPQPLALTNPFLDPPPRLDNPESPIYYLTSPSFSSFTAPTAQSSWTSLDLNEKHSPLTAVSAATSRIYPQAQPAAVPESPRSVYSASSNVYEYGTEQHPYLPVQVWSAGACLRQHTATPHSIHSVAPSMHHLPPTTTYQAPAPFLPAPEPVFRSHSAAPRLDHRSSLPNPFATLPVRRYGTVPNGQHHGAPPRPLPQRPLHNGHIHGGQGGTYVSARNAMYFTDAFDKVPPRVQADGLQSAQSPEQWRQLVLSAARGRAL